MPPTPKFIYWSADPQEVQNFSLFGGENFKEVIKLNETIRISPNPGSFPEAHTVKNLPAMQEIRVWSLGWEVPLEKGMAIHSSILAWRIPWTEKPGGLQSMGLQRVGHNWATNTHRIIDVLIRRGNLDIKGVCVCSQRRLLRALWEGGRLQAQEAKPASTLILYFLTPRTVQNLISVV